MDIESLEAANQSLQADLKLAFKRIGDLQAAIEDEMESDDNEDLINRYNNLHSCVFRLLEVKWRRCSQMVCKGCTMNDHLSVLFTCM